MVKPILDTDTLVDVAWYRVSSIVVFGVTAAAGLLLITFGESVHKAAGAYGELQDGQIAEAHRVFLTNFILPVAAVVVAFLTVADWKKRKKDKIYLWQARLAMLAFCGTCLLITAVVCHAFLRQAWATPIPLEGPLPSSQFPKGLQPGDQLNWFFGLCGSLFLTASLAFGVLVGDKVPSKPAK